MNRSTRRARIYAAASAALLVLAVIAVVIAVRAQRQAPSPPKAAASPVDVVPTTPDRTSTATTSPSTSHAAVRGPILARSVPVHLAIPAIHVSSSVQKLGLAADGSVQVPPLGRDSHAGWYTGSPTPGQLGPSVVLGHIDSAAYGPGVFFRLGDLRQRDRIDVTLADKTVAVFEVERVVEYSKKRFPTLDVYGNLDHAGLRLITCGGTFDPTSRNYADNIVAYASLVSSHHA